MRRIRKNSSFDTFGIQKFNKQKNRIPDIGYGKKCRFFETKLYIF